MARASTETWNWILGLLYIFLVALIWIVASFIVQSVIDSGVSPFLISYICNSLFVVYIPIVEASQCVKSRFSSTEKEVDNSSTNLTNSEKSKLLEDEILIEKGGSSESQLTSEASEMNIEKSDVEERRLWTRKETAKVSLIICPIWFFAQYTFNLSLKYTTVTSNTILSSTSTLFTFLVALAFLGESFTFLKLSGVLLCMAGTIIVALGDSETIAKEAAPHPVIGDMICLMSAVFYACYTTLIRKNLPDESQQEKGKVSTALFLGYLGLFNALLFLPIVLLLHFTGIEPIHALSLRQWGLIVGKGIFDNVISDYLWAKAVLLTSTTVATAGLTLQVPIAAVVDSIRGHAIGVVNIIGGVAVLCGFVGINYHATTTKTTTTTTTATATTTATPLPSSPQHS